MILKISSLLLICALAFAKHETNEEPVKEKIQGGTVANPGEFPYQVSVSLNYQHLCGGALITRRHVLTSGSCLQGIVKNPTLLGFTKVLVGTNYLLTRDANFEYPVSRVVVHPDYYYENLWNYYVNDIGILTLATEVPVSNFIKPVKLPLGHEMATRSRVYTTGWGTETAWNGPNVSYLKKTNLYYLNPAECQAYFPGKPMLPSQLCTAPMPNVGTCASDTGSPLIYKSRVVGVSSGFHGCGTNLPDVFTRVYPYMSWVINEVRATSPYEFREYDYLFQSNAQGYSQPQSYSLGAPEDFYVSAETSATGGLYSSNNYFFPN